jgi:hypothetical protein
MPPPETSMSRATIPKNIELSEIQQEDGMRQSDIQSKAVSFDNFKANHWSDAQIYYGNSRTVDLERQITDKFIKVTAEARQKFAALIN